MPWKISLKGWVQSKDAMHLGCVHARITCGDLVSFVFVYVVHLGTGMQNETCFRNCLDTISGTRRWSLEHTKLTAQLCRLCCADEEITIQLPFSHALIVWRLLHLHLISLFCFPLADHHMLQSPAHVIFKIKPCENLWNFCNLKTVRLFVTLHFSPRYYTGLRSR